MPYHVSDVLYEIWILQQKLKEKRTQKVFLLLVKRFGFNYGPRSAKIQIKGSIRETIRK